MTRPSSTATFFTTFELVEQTLSHLSMLEIVRAQIISPFCRDVISNSPHLQRLLFFLPAQLTPDSEGQTRPQLNPIFEGHFFRPKSTFERSKDVLLEYFTWFHNARHRDAFLRADASWRRMLITSSATTRVAIDQSVVVNGEEFSRFAFVPFASSTRTGEDFIGSPRIGQFWDIAVASLHAQLHGCDHLAHDLSVSCYNEGFRQHDHIGSSEMKGMACRALISVYLSPRPSDWVDPIDDLAGRELVERAFADSISGKWAKVMEACMNYGHSDSPEREMALALWPLPTEDDPDL